MDIPVKESWSKIPELIGKTFHTVKVKDTNDTVGYSGIYGRMSETLQFHSKEGRTVFGHIQECCESVSIKQIDGDLKDLENSPITQAEEVTIEIKDDSYEDGRATATFYKFATNKGYVTVQWIGESNGCYSESVDMLVIPKVSTLE